jgi:hypothetical protein
MRGEDTQQLRDAIARWRADLDRTNKRLAELGPESAEWQSKFLERRALEIAIKALDLCITRRVVPRFVCPDAFVTEVVIPTKPRSVESESTIELSRHSHGPVVVECEYNCASALDALALVDDAQRASVFTRGWAPLYVRLWVELLRYLHRLEHPDIDWTQREGETREQAVARWRVELKQKMTSPQKPEGPRLVVAPEPDGETNDG